eukprot:scaffold58527_cov13-Tisochrysis_lutea.AAC.1
MERSGLAPVPGPCSPGSCCPGAWGPSRRPQVPKRCALAKETVAPMVGGAARGAAAGAAVCVAAGGVEIH